jgi:hypothetical protein
MPPKKQQRRFVKTFALVMGGAPCFLSATSAFCGCVAGAKIL